MNRHEITIAEQAHEQLSRVVAVLPVRLERMEEETSPLRASGGGGTHGGGTPDPTAAAALIERKDGTSVHTDRRNLEANLRTIRNLADLCVKILARYPDAIPVVPDFCEDCQRDQDSNGNTLRLSAYGGGAGPRICKACRAKRDRKAAEDLAESRCPSVLTRKAASYPCELDPGHSGEHLGGGWSWPNHEGKATA